MALNRIAFVGLGIMGRPMALNLVKAGYQLHVYARKAESLAPLRSAGAAVCPTPRDAMAAADCAITMVSDTPDVEQVMLGADGFLEGAKPGGVIMDMSTIDPQRTRYIARRIKAHGACMLDAPVSGGETGAIDGTLSIMVGGDAAVFERALPVLQAMGKNIVHIGPSGAGQVAKACNQLLVAQTILAVGEALEFALSLDVDAGRVRTALLGGFANSRILEIHGLRLLENEFTPGFKAGLLLKDLNIIVSTLEKNGLHYKGTRHARDMLDKMVARGDGELDCAALGRMVG